MDASVLTKTVSTQPVLETERLTLRPLRKSDAGLVSLYSSDIRVARMTSSIPHPNPPGAVEAFIETVTGPDSRETAWAIDATKGFGCEIIGVVGLRRDGELGYWLGPFFWGLGIATEAARAVVTHAFEVGHERVHACAFQDNPASKHVLEKAGLRETGTCEGFSVARGETVKTWTLERLRSDA